MAMCNRRMHTSLEISRYIYHEILHFYISIYINFIKFLGAIFNKNLHSINILEKFEIEFRGIVGKIIIEESFTEIKLLLYIISNRLENA